VIPFARMAWELPDYGTQLAAAVEGYCGPRERAVRRAGVVFGFYTRLLVDPRVPRDVRTIVSGVIAYFVVPDDVMSEEELGPIGLVDDLYLAAYAYRQLARDLPPHVLLEAWSEEDSIEDVMAEVYRECRAEVGKRSKDVLRMAGLQ
jgi:uncharacterized membrane protein YkvA (DUF1232 family)